MPRQRRIRIHHTSEDGHACVLEEVTGRPHPQLRVWIAAEGCYRRQTIPVPLRDGSGRRDPARIAAALAAADIALPSLLTRNTMTSPAPDTVVAAFEFATNEKTGKQYGKNSDQRAEWVRAAAEARAVIDPSLPLAALSAAEMTGIARSALARVALERVAHAVDIKTWTVAITDACAELGMTDRCDMGVITLAFQRTKAAVLAKHGPRTAPRREITKSWAVRTLHLVRAMLRYAAESRKTQKQFQEGKDVTLPSNLATDLEIATDKLGIRIEEQPFRPTHKPESARDLFHHLADPRYDMVDALSCIVGTAGAVRTPRSWIRLTGDTGVDVRRNSGSIAVPRLTWYPLPPASAAVVRLLLANEYADIEAAAQAARQDYRPVADVVWRDSVLRRVDGPAAIDSHRDVGLLDPRARQLFDLGAEGRAGQVVRCMRSHLKIDARSGEVLLNVPGTAKKKGRVWFLAPAQRLRLALSMEIGHLAELERRYRLPDGNPHRIDDYPLFVGGELRDGRAMPETRDGTARALISVNDKTLNDWHVELEEILGITHVDGRAQYGWRRAFVNIYDGWTGSDRVKNLITGHTKLGPMTHGSTRDEVYLDPADVPLLREGQRLMEHARTAYVTTGEAPSELERHFPARHGTK
jgi:hypothetical protein